MVTYGLLIELKPCIFLAYLSFPSSQTNNSTSFETLHEAPLAVTRYRRLIMAKNLQPSVVERLPVTPVIVPRAEHCISRKAISEAALNVLYRLKNAGYGAYLVGGGVRDLLLGRVPKDFDVATDARPEQVRELFRNCRLIGRRFRLAHVRYGSEIIEVATFRAGEQLQGDRVTEEGRILRDNVYGQLEDDVWRRDFTVNALYYDVRDFTVVDYVGGMKDIEAGRLRLIGEPQHRYREDPVRLLRAVRFAVKLGMRIDPETERPIKEMAPLLEEIPVARLFEEVLKLFLGGYAAQTFAALRHHELLQWLFPQLEHCLAGHDAASTDRLVMRALENTDERLAQSKPVTPAFLMAAFLWTPVRERSAHYISDGVPPMEALQLAADAVLSKQVATLAIPRRLTKITREIWSMQPRFERRTGKRAERLAAHPRFRAAYDFLLLRADSGEDVQELCQWWAQYHANAPQERGSVTNGEPRRARRPRRRRPRD